MMRSDIASLQVAAMLEDLHMNPATREIAEGLRDYIRQSELTTVRVAGSMDDTIAALEARIAELEPRAELGRLVEQMPDDTDLRRRTRSGQWKTVDALGRMHAHDTPVDALRALVGEKEQP